MNIDWSQVVTAHAELLDLSSKSRAARNDAISASSWLIERHRAQLELGLSTSISSLQYSELLGYHQLLRDWPESEGWPNIELPPAPSWLPL